MCHSFSGRRTAPCKFPKTSYKVQLLDTRLHAAYVSLNRGRRRGLIFLSKKVLVLFWQNASAFSALLVVIPSVSEESPGKALSFCVAQQRPTLKESPTLSASPRGEAPLRGDEGQTNKTLTPLSIFYPFFFIFDKTVLFPPRCFYVKFLTFPPFSPYFRQNYSQIHNQKLSFP